jgi:hypothetical protein
MSDRFIKRCESGMSNLVSDLHLLFRSPLEKPNLVIAMTVVPERFGRMLAVLWMSLGDENRNEDT